MALRRRGLILTWTVDVAFFSASPCGLPQNLGGSGGLGGGPVLALKIPCIKLWSGSSSISADYTSLPLRTGGNQEHVHP